jgi:hypothetical protein
MMKKLIIISFLILSLFACSEPEPNLQLFNAEAFAYDIGDSWEVNATVNVKGFLQREIEDSYRLKLSYSVDLVTPESDSLTSIFNDVVEETNDEEIVDLPLEAQLEIDSAFTEGVYSLFFNVKDEYSNQYKSVKVNFDLLK